LLGGKSAANIAFLVSVVLSLSISALAVSKMLTSPLAMQNYVSVPQLGDRNYPASNGAGNALEERSPSTQDRATEEERSQSSDNADNRASGGLYGGGAGYATDDRLSPAMSQQKPDIVTGIFFSPIYDSSPYILPITWVAVAGTLIWRGKVRSQWCKQGYDYDTFRLLARMKGSPIRVALLTSVSAAARTRAQMAADLDVDWKTIDNHIDVLARNGLVQEIGAFGTCRYYAMTERGKRVLSLLLSLDEDSSADIAADARNNDPKVTMN
jgi:hypothetical protein